LAQSATDVAVHFGVDVRTVHNWKTKRDFPVGPPYDLDAITQWNRSRGQSTGQDEDDAAARRTEAQAKLLELKLQKASGELLDYENVRRLLVRHITEAGTIFDQIPLRVVALLPNECPIESEWPSIRAQVRKNAEQIVSSARQVLADMLAAKEMVKPEEPPACSN
jgi:phage terminase Nu1 subunit (DNA packaging protein)